MIIQVNTDTPAYNFLFVLKHLDFMQYALMQSKQTPHTYFLIFCSRGKYQSRICTFCRRLATQCQWRRWSPCQLTHASPMNPAKALSWRYKLATKATWEDSCLIPKWSVAQSATQVFHSLVKVMQIICFHFFQGKHVLSCIGYCLSVGLIVF